MILLAESGSTKTDWVLLGDDKNVLGEFKTIGLNPFFLQDDTIELELRSNAEMMKFALDVSSLHFFGSGCSSADRCARVHKGLTTVFPSAKIFVSHDMLAAAYATCGREAGIVGILGTGSNSCLFDGNETSEKLPALGYILGDEGSGTYFGKQILKDFCYGKLPETMQHHLQDEFQLNKDFILEKVYRHGHANVYIASFAEVLKHFDEENYVRELLQRGFGEFIELHILCYEQCRDLPVHFIGSIAWNFRDILIDSLKSYNLKPGKILSKPSDALLEYFAESA